MNRQEAARSDTGPDQSGSGSTAVAAEVHIDSVDSCTRSDDGGDADASLLGRLVDSILKAIGLREDEKKRHDADEPVCRPDDEENTPE